MTHVDLHVHSRHSIDGDLAPTELIRMAKAAGIGVVAISDHNTVGGVGEALVEGEELGVTVIPAIEIDCHYGARRLHVLGYRIDHRDPRYDRLIASVTEMERAASNTLLDKGAAARRRRR